MTPLQRPQCFTTLFNSRPSLVVNSFYSTSQLKPRIQMLYQSRNTGRILWKYTLVLPLLAVLICLTAAREQLVETLTIQPGKTITVSGRVVDSQNRPVKGVQVFIQQPVGSFANNQLGAIERVGSAIKTDGQGHYKLAGVDPTAKIEFIHSDYIVMVMAVKQLRDIKRVSLLNKAEVQKFLKRTGKGKQLVGANDSRHISRKVHSIINKDITVSQPNATANSQSLIEADNGPAVVVYKKLGEEGPVIFIDGIEQNKNFDVSSIRAKDVDSVAGFLPPFQSGQIVDAGDKAKYKYGIIRIKTKTKKP